MLAACTSEDPTNLNQIILFYLKDIVISSTDNPTSKFTYKIGVFGKYFVKGLIDDPVNSYLAYLFATDYNINSETFGVFKIDFTPTSLNYVYTTLTMGSG